MAKVASRRMAVNTPAPTIHPTWISRDLSATRFFALLRSFIMPFLLCFFYIVRFFCFNPIINTGSSYPKGILTHEITIKKLRLFLKLAVYLSRTIRLWQSFIKTSLQAEERYGLMSYVSPGLTMGSTRVSNLVMSLESRMVFICFRKNLRPRWSMLKESFTVV